MTTLRVPPEGSGDVVILWMTREKTMAQEIVATRALPPNSRRVPRPTKKVSQTQLARELGISQALVSLVLNGRKQGINAETYDRIWAHAVKRGYHPKGMRLASSPAAQ